MDVNGLSGNDKTLNAHNEDKQEGNAPKPVGDHPSDAAQAEPEYMPFDPPPPPKPFDSAKITDPHPDKTTGGVLQWVVNVERPLPYAVILEDQEIFEIAHWLANQPLSDKGSNAFLKMSRNQDLPWKNVQQFNKSIDSMPHGPGCEMWTGDWWWQMQNILGKGATVCPVILASNKTQLTTLSGGCQVWPVYLMISNISKRICCRPGEGASLLVGYIPADSLETCYSKEDKRRKARWKLFHKAMELIVWLFAEVSCKGKEVVCANGGVCCVHPILAAYMGNLAEQWLVTCTQQDHCPVCLVPPDKKGNIFDCYPQRTREQVLQAINDYVHGVRNTIKTLGIRKIKKPFWSRMPFTNIFGCMPPDILHQLDKGIFGDYMVKWSRHILGKGEFNRQLKGMPQFLGLQHFKFGIEPIPSNQWTGNKAKSLG
ncbi:Zn-finger protein [Rhizoctonia solani]|uniref:Zn-finger protein n=1 Tax=Rhizoctonia solani TaxID=456999 RepID=A0A8H7H279_9AGAM|nr:Zn-finger protein [Rhizoctonia solani]